jgi:prepilin-type N-terminal cleavage/methylation domain-containing protein
MRGGFTLIELLVVSGIVLLLSAGILANYNTYNQTQQLRQEALTVQSDLRLIQSNAINGVDPDNTTCAGTGTTFAGYLVNFTNTGYIVAGMCSDGSNIWSTTVVKSYSSGVTDANGSLQQRTFEPLTGKIASDITITLKSISGTCYAFTIESGGNINDGGIVTCP